MEEQSNLLRKLAREIREAKVSIYLLHSFGGATPMLSIGRMVPDEHTGSYWPQRTNTVVSRLRLMRNYLPV